MKTREALQYLFSLEKRGIHMDLGPVSRLFHSLGNPQNSYRTVHVGGTNGKGSVSAMLASILTHAGYRTGLYTSPHLVDFRERIRVDGAMIPEGELARLISRVREHMTEETTFFECATALAFLHFLQASVDIAVVEVGMGGRLDATNCINPEASIITNISLEHQAYLGKSLASIAVEKGGIIKDGGICITGATQSAVRSVLENIATERKAELFVKGRDFSIRRHRDGSCSYYGMDRTVRPFRVPLPGAHQVDNAALAFAAAEVLCRRGTIIDQGSMIGGIEATCWEGRFERIGEDPLIVIDGAHNRAGMRSLFRAIPAELGDKRPILLFGVMADKQWRAMLATAASGSEKIIITFPIQERTKRLEVGDIEAMGLERGFFEIIPDPSTAYSRAVDLARKMERAVIVAGSLYLAGEIKRLAASK